MIGTNMLDEDRPVRRVGIYGPFGWGNLGDAAIQESMIANIRERLPKVEIVGYSLNPENTQQLHGISSVAIVRSWRPRQAPAVATSKRVESHPAPSVRAGYAGLKRVLKRLPVVGDLLVALRRVLEPLFQAGSELTFMRRVFCTLRDVDVFIISGGGQVADFWGGAWHHPYTMLKWVVCARLARCRVFVVSVGTGPIQAPLSGLFLRSALRLAHYRSYRDVESHALVSRWGFTRHDPVYPDLAFSYPLDSPPPPPRAEAAPPVIGISPLCYHYPVKGPWPDQDPVRYRRYLETIRDVTVYARDAGHPIVLFSSQIRNDRYAFDDLLEMLAADGLPKGTSEIESTPTRNLDHVLAQIAKTDVVVTSRLHGVILSYLLHRPVLALSYDPKIDAVMRAFGQSYYCLDIESAPFERARERLDDLLANLAVVQWEIATRAIENRTRLEHQYDRLFGQRSQPDDRRDPRSIPQEPMT